MTVQPLPAQLSVTLNLLRGISAQLVLLTHLLSFLLPSFHPSPKIIPMASLGVILFFLLSGFLITHTLLAHRDKGLQSYLIDRFCRIYPPYIATLVLVALIDYVYITSFPQQYSEHGYRYTVGRFLTGAFFLPKFNFHTGMAIFGSASQLWTLPVEWWLYLGAWYCLLHVPLAQPVTTQMGMPPICNVVPGDIHDPIGHLARVVTGCWLLLALHALHA